MACIKFSCSDEFMEELALLRHQGRIDRPEVRFTVVTKPSQEQPSFHFITAVATAMVGPDFLLMEYCCGACHIATDWRSEKPYWDEAWEILVFLEPGLHQCQDFIRGVLAHGAPLPRKRLVSARVAAMNPVIWPGNVGARHAVPLPQPRTMVVAVPTAFRLSGRRRWSGPGR